jgi:pyridoxamine 5'-phosphate oxidase
MIGIISMNAHALNTEELYHWIEIWNSEEMNPRILGVLATVDKSGKPHTRTVAIREINADGILFFTQIGSEKVKHFKNQSAVALTVILPKHSRQISFCGEVSALSNEENQKYWEGYPKKSQIRFMVYGPKSGRIISDNSSLDSELLELTKENKSFKRPDAYVGFRIHPSEIKLYQLNSDRISDSFVMNKESEKWDVSRVVP